MAAQEEMQEKIVASDERSKPQLSFPTENCWFPRYAGLRSVNIHLEGNILELQERWVRRKELQRGNNSLFQARGEKRRGKKGGSPSNEYLESIGPASSTVGSQGSSDAGEYIRFNRLERILYAMMMF